MAGNVIGLVQYAQYDNAGFVNHVENDVRKFFHGPAAQSGNSKLQSVTWRPSARMPAKVQKLIIYCQRKLAHHMGCHMPVVRARLSQVAHCATLHREALHAERREGV